jgi:hypothetical protein
MGDGPEPAEDDEDDEAHPTTVTAAMMADAARAAVMVKHAPWRG